MTGLVVNAVSIMDLIKLKTGNYNKVISEMYDVGRNGPSNCISKTQESEEFPKLIDNSFKLCSTCNRNQLLKSRQIAKFEPISEICFDQEFNEFKSKLDDLYGLCKKSVLTKSLMSLSQSLMICMDYVESVKRESKDKSKRKTR